MNPSSPTTSRSPRSPGSRSRRGCLGFRLSRDGWPGVAGGLPASLPATWPARSRLGADRCEGLRLLARVARYRLGRHDQRVSVLHLLPRGPAPPSARFPFFIAAFARRGSVDRDGKGESKARGPESKRAAGLCGEGGGLLPSSSLVAAAAIAANLWNPAIAISSFRGRRSRDGRPGAPGLGSAVVGAHGVGAVIGRPRAHGPYRASFQLPYNGMARRTLLGYSSSSGSGESSSAVARAGLILERSEETEAAGGGETSSWRSPALPRSCSPSRGRRRRWLPSSSSAFWRVARRGALCRATATARDSSPPSFAYLRSGSSRAARSSTSRTTTATSFTA